MNTWNKELLTKKLITITDPYLLGVKDNWYSGAHKSITNQEFIPMASEWFKSTKRNDIQGWDNFPCIDVIMGCTHFIESFVLKYGWDDMQILPYEYSYYSLMGKYGTEPGSLEPGKPLILSLPNWKYADLRPGWDEILRECETKDIDIHIDFAWITTARDIQIDLNHPNIKSFAMSMSKYNLQWNRVGLRWARQRTMDSISMFNQYYSDVNSGITSCGAYMIDNIPRDYTWNTYENMHYEICQDLNLIPTKLIHVAKSPETYDPVGIGRLISVTTNTPNEI
jgi:hypothetical protein